MPGLLPVVFLAVVFASVDSRPAESELKLTFSPNHDFPDRYFNMTLESNLQFGEDAQWSVENQDGTQQAIHGTRIPGSTNMVFPQVPCSFYEGAIVLRYSVVVDLKRAPIKRRFCEQTTNGLIGSYYQLVCFAVQPLYRRSCNSQAEANTNASPLH